MAEIVKIEGDLETDAIRVLRGIPGITVKRMPVKSETRADAVIEFSGTRRGVALEFKQRLNSANAWQVVHQAGEHPEMPIILVAEESTGDARAILRSHGVALLDGLGNAHVEMPGILLHLEGSARGTRQSKARPPKLAGKAGVITQALLLSPDRQWHITELADEAEVSPSLVHRVLGRLEAEDLVDVEGAGPKTVRTITDPTALLDLWAEEEKRRSMRTLGYVLAQTPRQLIESVGTELQKAEIVHAMTGAAAASLFAPFATAIPVVEVWTSAIEAPSLLLKVLGGEIVAEGSNVAILQQKDDTPLAFRERQMGKWVSNRFRIYFDLLNDPRRGPEQAQHLRREAIGF